MSDGKGRNKAARLIREQRARERRRKRAFWTSAGAVAVLVVASLIGWSVYASQQAGTYSAPAGANSDGTGIVVGSGPVTIDVYEDFMCPHCKQFEEQAGATLKQLVADGKARVVYHPVAYLNRFSTTQYSTRSSAASGCAAQHGKFREFVEALFGRQPAEGGPGLTNNELISIGTGVGLDAGSFGSCVRDQTYESWTKHVTDEASRAGINGTPTVKVNGKTVQSSAEAISAAVTAAGG